MAVSSHHSPEPNSANHRFYAASFIRKSHQVLKAGYDRLNPASFASSKEEDITGELTRGMQDALQDAAAPRWFGHFWVTEEVHVHHSKRRGKNRKRLDIEIIKSQSGKRPVLRFEAKRLRTDGDAGKYLGKTGLGCFLDGSYGPNDDTVGMIGYVQRSDVGSHAKTIEAKLGDQPDDFSVDRTVTWEEFELVNGLTTYRSRHFRAAQLLPVDVVHTLMQFN